MLNFRVNPDLSAAVLVVMVTGGHAFGQTPEQLALQTELKQKQDTMISAFEQAAAGYRDGIESRQQERESLKQEIDGLVEEKEALKMRLAERQEALAQRKTVKPEPVDNRYDSVVFTTGRTVKCSVVSYQDRQFKLEDQNGDSLHVFPASLAGIRFRNQTVADIFPAHSVNKGPLSTRVRQTAAPVAIPTPALNIPLREHMFDVRVSRRKSDAKINERMGYIDERSEVVQFDCTVESKGLPTDMEGFKAHIWVVAQGAANEDNYKLIISDRKTFGLERIDDFSFETSSVTLKYDEKGRGRYGYSLYGWVFLLEDPDGNTVALKRNKKALEDHLDKIKNMSVDKIFRL